MRHVGDRETRVGECEVMQGRDINEILRMRAYLLCGIDRTLLEVYLEHGNKIRQIARLTGLSHTSIRRRIHGIMRRLTDDTYALCLDNRDDFTGRELAMIKDYFITGLPMERISRNRRVTLYRVKAIVGKARRYAASARAPCPGRPGTPKSSAVVAHDSEQMCEGIHYGDL